MRTILVAVAIALAVPHVSYASQWPVVITTESGAKIRGRLLSITPERVTISRQGRLDPIPMDSVIRVVKPRDPVLDGLLKGLFIGALPLLLWGDDVDPGWAARYVAGYAIIGAGVDAVHSDAFVVYDRTASRSAPRNGARGVGWTIRF